LRNTTDNRYIQDIIKTSKKVVVIGGSFIGCETAGAIKNELKENVDVTVVEPNSAIFERVLGA